MSLQSLILPEGYVSRQDILETERAIKLAKDTLEQLLADRLRLTRVSAPLFVRPETGLNDDLNGVERPVTFDVPDAGAEVAIVHSLAKWKRQALKLYGFAEGTGLYTDMNAIRRDESLDNLHSVYVDQWDWEKILAPADRTVDTLRVAVRTIWQALRDTQHALCAAFPALDAFLPEEVVFLSSQELEDRWPDKTPHEREDLACREYGAVFVSQIGGKLRSGAVHDGRAPDYDDWQLNGDILVWNPVLSRAFEISSMGIRVNPESLRRQLAEAGCEARAALPFHRQLLAGELPLTMGGGIGHSRVCMLLLQKAHIGEVQSSVWPDDMAKACACAGIRLL